MIPDQDILSCLARLLEAGAPGSPGGKGLPIGNLTSQHLANFHLSELDKLILGHPDVGAYVRYMDDMLVYADHKASLWQVLHRVESWLHARGLRLHPHIRVVAPTHEGVNFLGYRVWPGVVRLQGSRKRRWWRQVRASLTQGNLGKRGRQSLESRFQAISRANTLCLRREALGSMESRAMTRSGR